MDSTLREIERRLKSGEPEAFQNLVLARCRVGDHIWHEFVHIRDFRLHELQAEVCKRYQDLILTEQEKQHGANFGVNITFERCLWCKADKTKILWWIQEKAVVFGTGVTHYTHVREGCFEI